MDVLDRTRQSLVRTCDCCACSCMLQQHQIHQHQAQISSYTTHQSGQHPCHLVLASFPTHLMEDLRDPHCHSTQSPLAVTAMRQHLPLATYYGSYPLVLH